MIPHIRWMIRRDIPVVLEIAAQRESTQMSEEELLTLLRDRNVIGMVAEYGDLIVGYRWKNYRIC